MAYLPQSELDKEEENQSNLQSGQAPQAPVLSGPSSVASPTAASSVEADRKPTRSGSYTNLNSYIAANSDQGGAMAQKLVDKVDSDASAGKASLSNVQNTFNQQVASGGVSRNQDLVNETISNPNSVLADSQKKAQLQQIRDASYKGPNSLMDVDGYQDARQKLTGVSSTVQNLQSESGRAAALKDNFGRPTYSAGQNALDQVILQNAPEARDKFKGLSGTYSNLTSYLSDADSAATSAAQSRKAETSAAKQDLFSAVGGYDDASTSDIDEGSGYFGSLQSGLKTRVSEANTARDAQLAANAAAKADLAQRRINAANASALGLSDGLKTYNVDPSQFLNLADGMPASTQNVATGEEYSKYAAINELLGLEDTFLGQQSAGTYKAPSMALNPEFQSALAAAKSSYDNAYNTETLGGAWGDIGRPRTVKETEEWIAQNAAPEGQPGDAAAIRNRVREWINARGGNNKVTVY